MVSPARTLVARQGVLLRRADPRHIRMTVEVAAAFRAPTFPLVTLGSLLVEEIKYGTSSRVTADGVGVAVLRMNNLTMSGWDTSDLKYLDASREVVAGLELRAGDILVNRSNSLSQVGKAAVFDLTGTWLFASFLLRLRVDADKVLPDFLALFLNSPAGRLQLERLARPILGMANISPTELRSVLIPLPDKERQAALLLPLRAALDAKNAKTAEAIATLMGINDDFSRLVGPAPAPTVRQIVFSTTTRNLRVVDRLGAQFFHPERAAILRAVMTLPGADARRLDTLVDFVEVRGAPTEGETVFGLSAVEPHTGEILPAIDDPAAGKRFQVEDLLYSRLRPYLNKVALMTHAGLCSPEFYVLRPKERVDPSYLAVALRSPLVLRQVSHMTTGNTHPRVAEDDAKAILVPMPTLPVQQTVVAAMAARRAQAVAAREDAQRDWDAALAAFGASLLG